jgi:hypothetical protein
MAFMALPTLANHPGDRDCPSFDSQAQAQSFFIRHGGPESDGDRLDANSNGDACESYDYGSGGGNDDDDGDDDDNTPPADDEDDTGGMPDTSTPSDAAPILPLMLVGVFGGSALFLYRRRLAL